MDVATIISDGILSHLTHWRIWKNTSSVGLSDNEMWLLGRNRNSVTYKLEYVFDEIAKNVKLSFL